MSAMADFARMPTRQKVMVFSIIGLLLGLGYYQFIYKGLKADLEAVDNENAGKNTNNKRLEADIPAFEALKARHAVLKRIIDENQKALPTEAELPAFFETLNRKVLESGVEVVRSKQLPEERIETFARVPVEYEIVGTYVQIKKFFASLVAKRKKAGQVDASSSDGGEVEERERIVSIENLSLSNPVVRNREIKLTARFVASTYRMDDGSAPAPAKKAAPKPAGAPAGAAPAGSAPAMPPAATPAGAKARTDNAMDKNEQRNPSENKPPGAAGLERMKGGI